MGYFLTEQASPWQDPVAGYGYCLWGVMNAAAPEREGFEAECAGLVEYLSVEEEDAAIRLAEGL